MVAPGPDPGFARFFREQSFVAEGAAGVPLRLFAVYATFFEELRLEREMSLKLLVYFPLAQSSLENAPEHVRSFLNRRITDRLW